MGPGAPSDENLRIFVIRQRVVEPLLVHRYQKLPARRRLSTGPRNVAVPVDTKRPRPKAVEVVQDFDSLEAAEGQVLVLDLLHSIGDVVILDDHVLLRVDEEEVSLVHIPADLTTTDTRIVAPSVQLLHLLHFQGGQPAKDTELATITFHDSDRSHELVVQKFSIILINAEV